MVDNFTSMMALVQQVEGSASRWGRCEDGVSKGAEEQDQDGKIPSSGTLATRLEKGRGTSRAPRGQVVAGHRA